MTSVYYLSGTPIETISKHLFGPPLFFNEVTNVDQGFTETKDTPGSILLWQITSHSDHLKGFLKMLNNYGLSIVSEIAHQQQYYWIVSYLENTLDVTHQCIQPTRNSTIRYLLTSSTDSLKEMTNSWQYEEGSCLVRIRINGEKHKYIDNRYKDKEICLTQFPEPEKDGTWLPFPPQRLSDLHNAVGELRSKGLQIAGLHVGEMSQRPHSVVLDSVCKILQGNEPLGYTTCRGYPTLQEIIRQDLVKRKLITGKNLSVLCTNGARQALFQSLLYLLGSQQSNHEVIIPTPCWGAYSEMTRMLGGKSIHTRLLPNGDLDLPELKSKLNSRSRVLILCSPHNPTSTIISRENLLELAEITTSYSNLVILSDEVYERLTFPKHHHSSPASIAKL